MDEQKAVETLNKIQDRAMLTQLEVDLSNLCIKRRNIIRKAIEYLKDNADYEQDANQFCDDLNYDLCSELLNILTGENNDRTRKN
jgi:hypothetical protein